MSLNNKKINFSEHSMWFKKKIKEKGNLWIFSLNNKKCGVIYLTKKKYYGLFNQVYIKKTQFIKEQ